MGKIFSVCACKSWMKHWIHDRLYLFSCQEFQPLIIYFLHLAVDNILCSTLRRIMMCYIPVLEKIVKFLDNKRVEYLAASWHSTCDLFQLGDNFPLNVAKDQIISWLSCCDTHTHSRTNGTDDSIDTKHVLWQYNFILW